MGKSESVKSLVQACGSHITQGPVIDKTKDLNDIAGSSHVDPIRNIMLIDWSSKAYSINKANQTTRDMVTATIGILKKCYTMAEAVGASYDKKPSSGAKANTQATRIKESVLAEAKKIDVDVRTPAAIFKNPENATLGGYDWELGVPPEFIRQIEDELMEEKGLSRESMADAFRDPATQADWASARQRRILDSFRYNTAYDEAVLKCIPGFHSRYLEQIMSIALAAFTPPPGCLLVFDGAAPHTWFELLKYWGDHNDDSELDPMLRRRGEEVGFDYSRGISSTVIYTCPKGIRYEMRNCRFFVNFHDEADRCIPWLMQQLWLVSLRTGSLRSFFKHPDVFSGYVADHMQTWMESKLPQRTVLVDCVDTDLIYLLVHALLVVASSILHHQLEISKTGNLPLDSELVRHLAFASAGIEQRQMALPFRVYKMSHQGAGVYKYFSIHGLAQELARRFQTQDVDEVTRHARELITYYAAFLDIDYLTKVPYSNISFFDGFFSRKLSDIRAGRWPSLFPNNRTTLSVWRWLIHLFRAYEANKRNTKAMMRRNEPWPEAWACDILIQAESSPDFRDSDLDAFILPGALSTVQDAPEEYKFSPVAGQAIIRAYEALSNRLMPASKKARANRTLRRHPHPMDLINCMATTLVYSVALFTVAVYEERPFHIGGELLAMAGTCYALRDPSRGVLLKSNYIGSASWDVERPFPKPSSWTADKGDASVVRLPDDLRERILSRPYMQAALTTASDDLNLAYIFLVPLMSIQDIATPVAETLCITDSPSKRNKSTQMLELEAAVDMLHAIHAQRREERLDARKEPIAAGSTGTLITHATVVSRAPTAMSFGNLIASDTRMANPTTAENLLSGLTEEDLNFDLDAERPAKRAKPLRVGSHTSSARTLFPDEPHLPNIQENFDPETVAAMASATFASFA